MIDLDALAGLRAVATHGSVVAAAAATGFTPSAISQQVKRLERQTGVPLLERVGRGVMLTSHGQHLVAAGEQVLADLEKLEAGLQQRAGVVAGRVRLAAFSTAMRGLIAPIARSLRDAHPDLTLTLDEREPWDVVDLVASGQAELGIVHRWGGVPLAVPDHVVSTPVATDLAELVVHRDDPLAARTRVTLHDLVDVGWIATPEGTICRQWLSRMYDGTGRPPRIAHVSGEFDVPPRAGPRRPRRRAGPTAWGGRRSGTTWSPYLWGTPSRSASSTRCTAGRWRTPLPSRRCWRRSPGWVRAAESTGSAGWPCLGCGPAVGTGFKRQRREGWVVGPGPAVGFRVGTRDLAPPISHQPQVPGCFFAIRAQSVRL